MKHNVVISAYGGTYVMSCHTLGIRGVELVTAALDKDDIPEKDVRNSISAFLEHTQSHLIDNLEFEIIDSRPPAENYNDKIKREDSEKKSSLSL